MNMKLPFSDEEDGTNRLNVLLSVMSDEIKEDEKKIFIEERRKKKGRV